MTDRTTETEALADVLRSASGWLRLAAERLDSGDLAGAYNMAKLGVFGCEDAPGRIDALTTQEVVA